MSTYWATPETFYQDPCYLFPNRCDLERLLNERYGDHNRPPIEEHEIEAEVLWNGDFISIWTDRVRRSSLRTIEEPECWKGGPLEGQAFPKRIAVHDQRITSAAISLIQNAIGSDSEMPPYLNQIRDAVELQEKRSPAKRGGYQGPMLTTYQLTFADGTTKVVSVLSEGYFEGYLYRFGEEEELLQWRRNL